MRNKIFYLGLLGLVFCHFSIIINLQFIRQWFYIAVWWSYILFIDGLIYRIKGNSLIISRTKSFFLMLPWSVFIWLVFELFNLRLQNWYYTNIEPVLWLRWPGYAIAYATVLPGIFETAELIEAVALKNKRTKETINTPEIIRGSSFPNEVAQGVSLRDPEAIPTWVGSFGTVFQSFSLFIGIITLGLTFLFPQYCFPLVWLCFIFILEPVVRGLNNWHKVFRLALAGLICGTLWEFWNWHSITHWVYALPYFHYLRIFQMPVLGYLGFLTFALECYLMYGFIIIQGYSIPWLTQERIPTKSGQHARPKTTYLILTYLLLTIFCLCSFYLLDNFTVHGFAE